ncbi:ANTAR domain-containing response regulator [Leucobacter tardus]|uniref:Response regulator n=1 Tax=Leucobacter tardus TaxID=501483 RepID=A0A939QEE1_9MICO|nr:response regulator [Leucobacter tardus]MBO2990587.1 response regulator [Leucobacter tardus]
MSALTQPQGTLPDTASHAPRRVLVAEDESLVLVDVVEFLTDNGFDVVGRAYDGESAVRLATELTPDLVLMDVSMPLRDGISATEILSRQGIGPVVLMTADGRRESYQRATSAGALGYLTKPVRPEGLLPTLEIALARHRQIRGLRSQAAEMLDQLESQGLVNRAKDVLIERFSLSAIEASAWLEQTAAERGLTEREVARTIVEGMKRKSRGRRR